MTSGGVTSAPSSNHSVDSSIEVTLVVHARRPSLRSCVACACLEGRAERTGLRSAIVIGPCRPGSRASAATATRGRPDVVMQDEDSALVDREPAKGPLQLVTVRDLLDVVDACSRRRSEAREWSMPIVDCAARPRNRREPGSGRPTPRNGRPLADAAACARSSTGRSAARPRRDVGSRRIRLATPRSVSLTWCTRSANASWSPERARSTTSRSKGPLR